MSQQTVDSEQHVYGKKSEDLDQWIVRGVWKHIQLLIPDETKGDW